MFFRTMRSVVKTQKGQSATEYVLVLAVVVLGLVAGASALIPSFNKGVNAVAARVACWLNVSPALFQDAAKNPNFQCQ